MSISVILIILVLSLMLMVMPLVFVVSTAYFCGSCDLGAASTYGASISFSVPISVVLLFMDMLVMVVVELLLVVVCRFLYYLYSW